MQTRKGEVVDVRSTQRKTGRRSRFDPGRFSHQRKEEDPMPFQVGHQLACNVMIDAKTGSGKVRKLMIAGLEENVANRELGS